MLYKYYRTVYVLSGKPISQQLFTNLFKLLTNMDLFLKGILFVFFIHLIFVADEKVLLQFALLCKVQNITATILFYRFSLGRL